MRTLKLLICVHINTDEPLENVKKGLKRGIYIGLDSASNNIAQPENVDIRYICEKD